MRGTVAKCSEVAVIVLERVLERGDFVWESWWAHCQEPDKRTLVAHWAKHGVQMSIDWL